MGCPQSIFDEVVRFQKIRDLVLKFGFLEYMQEYDLENLIQTLTWSNLDSYLDEKIWLNDLMKAVRLLSERHKLDLIGSCWPELLNCAIRKQSCRLDCIFDDDDDGESWKHAVGG